MPDREGEKRKRQRNRDLNRQRSRPHDKVPKKPRDQYMFDQDEEWAKSDDDNDSWYSDEFDSFDTNETVGADHHTSTTDNSQAQSTTQPTTIERSFSRFSYYHLNTSTEARHLDDRQLPTEVAAVFPNLESSLNLLQLIKELQDEEERFRSPTDALGNRALSRIHNSFPRERIAQHFKQANLQHSDQIDRNQILNYIRKAVLKKSSYGVLLYNSKREILSVQKFNGNWTAPRGYRKIRDNYQFETIRETVSRYFNDKIRVTNRTTNIPYQNYDIEQEHGLTLDKYVEYLLDDSRKGERFWCIGLFIIEIDESKLAFDLHDTYEYQACEWLNADEVLYGRRETSLDKFHTLRPFVERLENRLMFVNEISDS